jgi:hypothetical protein
MHTPTKDRHSTAMLSATAVAAITTLVALVRVRIAWQRTEATEKPGPQSRAFPIAQAAAPCTAFQIAESMGFKGDFRQWEDLVRVGD